MQRTIICDFKLIGELSLMQLLLRLRYRIKTMLPVAVYQCNIFNALYFVLITLVYIMYIPCNACYIEQGSNNNLCTVLQS